MGKSSYDNRVLAILDGQAAQEALPPDARRPSEAKRKIVAKIRQIIFDNVNIA
jgi:hypothetical protein